MGKINCHFIIENVDTGQATQKLQAIKTKITEITNAVLESLTYDDMIISM